MKSNIRGAASILVVLIIVVLATLGGIALTAGWTNRSLSIKAAQSKADYYTLDAAAEEVVAQTDSLLYEAMNETISYLASLMTVEELSAVSQDARLASIFARDADSITSMALKTKKLNETIRRIYFYESAKRLAAFANEKGMAVVYNNGFAAPEDFLNAENKVPESGDLILAFSLSEGFEPGQKILDVEIAADVPDVTAQIINEQTWRTDFTIADEGRGNRYEIYSWKLSQNPIEYEGENPKFG